MSEKPNSSEGELIAEILNTPSNISEDTVSPKSSEYLEAKLLGLELGSKIGAKFLANEGEAQRQRAETAEHKLKHDAKSGLATELFWKENLENIFESLNPNDKLIVMVADINNFKAVNDTLGHDSGDKLLKIVGDAFKETFKRETDFMTRGSRDNFANEPEEDSNNNEPEANLARLGGDEFAVYSNTSIKSTDENRELEDSESIIEQNSIRLNKAITSLLIGTEFEAFNISIALGGVEYSPDIDKIPRDIFVRADAKMYEVKYKDKIQNLTEADIKKLIYIIPYMESIGARVESWLKDAVFK